MSDAGMLGKIFDLFDWWQIVALVVLIALIVGLIMYRRRQM